jgi:DNA modification methylase
MTHLSSDCKTLNVQVTQITKLDQIEEKLSRNSPEVYLFWFPAGRTDKDASNSKEAFQCISNFCSVVSNESTVCILTTPPDAARFLPYLESTLKFKLWIAVKLSRNIYITSKNQLQKRHAALLILTRYNEALRHTKTRIRYTYCPACGKTTKDYGGKKHIYHEYGTLISDIWRDIECNPNNDIENVIRRLCDLFGQEPYSRLHVVDLRSCLELATRFQNLQETISPTSNDISIESQLINGDCLEVLSKIPDNSVDFCFADPPYNLKKKYDHWNDAIESVEYFKWCDKWLTELARILKPGRTLAVANIPLWTARYYQCLSSILKFQEWIAWDALGLPARMIMPAHYAILCFSKGERRSLPGLSAIDTHNQNDITTMGEFFCFRPSCIAQRKKKRVNDQEEPSDLWYDIHRLKHNSRRVDHPCQLPPKLMRRIFGLFTEPDELILDCFNGAGTSTLVAEQMNRRFIGIELSSEYHGIALNRHKKLKQGINPFGKCNIISKAKNSPVKRLPKQKYKITKKLLQLDVKRIAELIGCLPTRDEVKNLSQYPIEYFDDYFISWGEVCAAARTTGMSELPEKQENRTLDYLLNKI